MKKEVYEELTKIGERRLAKIGVNFSDLLQIEPGEILLSKRRALVPQYVGGTSAIGVVMSFHAIIFLICFTELQN